MTEKTKAKSKPKPAPATRRKLAPKEPIAPLPPSVRMENRTAKQQVLPGVSKGADKLVRLQVMLHPHEFETFRKLRQRVSPIAHISDSSLGRVVVLAGMEAIARRHA